VVLPDVEAHRLDVNPLAIHLRDAGLDAREALEVRRLDEALEVLRLGPIAEERPVVSDVRMRVEIDGERLLPTLGERRTGPREGAAAECRLKELPPMNHDELP
jgi:hypothetical protein